MRLTAHQPNFLPYASFVEKTRQADVLVLLNHAQFVRQNYHHRFHRDDRWYTMSVNAGNRDLINEKTYLYPTADWLRIKRLLGDAGPRLDVFDDCISDSLWRTNGAIIRRLLSLLGQAPRIEDDWPTAARGTARLVELCIRLGATEYLSGPSGRRYLDEHLFKDAGVRVYYFEPTTSTAAVDLLGEKRP